MDSVTIPRPVFDIMRLKAAQRKFLKEKVRVLKEEKQRMRVRLGHLKKAAFLQPGTKKHAIKFNLGAMYQLPRYIHVRVRDRGYQLLGIYKDTDTLPTCGPEELIFWGSTPDTEPHPSV